MTKANDRRTAHGAFDADPPAGNRPPAVMTEPPRPVPPRPGAAPPPQAVPGFAEFETRVEGRMGELGEHVAELRGEIEAIRTAAAEAETTQAGRFAELARGEELGELRERLEHMDQRGQRLEDLIGRGGMSAADPRGVNLPPWAREVAERHAEAFAAFQADSDRRAAFRAVLETRMDPRRRGAFDVSSVITDVDAVGDASIPTTLPGLTELLRDPIGLVDIVRMGPEVHADTFQEMVEEQVSQSKLHSAVRTAGTGGTTPVNTIAVDNVEGFKVGDVIYVFTSAGRQGPETITAIVSTAGSESLTFGTGEIDFDVAVGDLVAGDHYLATGEGSFKPARVLKASLQTCEMQTLASYIPTTRQRLRRTNVFNLLAWAADRLPMDLRENLEYHLLYGSGVASAGQLQGFLHATYLQNTDTWSTSMSVGDNRADLILHAASQIPGRGQVWAVLHKLDWRAITGAKDSAGNYVHGEGEGPRIINTPALKAIGDVRVVLTSQIAQTNGIVLDPMAASILCPEGDAELIVGYVNSQLVENESTILYEEGYGHLIVNALQAYRKVDMDAAPS